MSEQRAEYRSQYRQDEIIDRLLGARRNGVFVDVGAHDGVTLSNTYFFEKERAWTGVCFEPNPTVFQRLVVNRSCVCENVGVGTRAGNMSYLRVSGYAEMLSGFVDVYDPRHVKRIDNDIAEHGGSKEVLEIPVVSLNEYLLDRHILDIDYCSIDVEGGEFDVLRSLDFESLTIRILSVENNFWDQRMRAFMRDRKYELVRVAQTDDIYGRVGAVPRSPLREILLRAGGSLSVAGRVLERRLWG